MRFEFTGLETEDIDHLTALYSIYLGSAISVGKALWREKKRCVSILFSMGKNYYVRNLARST